MLQEEEERMVLINVVKAREAVVGSGCEADSLSVLAPGRGLEFSLFFFCSFKKICMLFLEVCRHFQLSSLKIKSRMEDSLGKVIWGSAGSEVPYTHTQTTRTDTHTHMLL